VPPESDSKNARLVSVERLIRKLDEFADAHREGALLVLEALPDSLGRLQSVASTDRVGEVLIRASDRAAHQFAGSVWARTGWNRVEFALEGAKDTLGAASLALLTDLSASDDCRMLDWRAVLTRVFPGNARRTLLCDCVYDLAGITTSAVVWVEPYQADDWEASRRYPTTEILWRKP
jgi:hypothetical protein